MVGKRLEGPTSTPLRRPAGPRKVWVGGTATQPHRRMHAL